MADPRIPNHVARQNIKRLLDYFKYSDPSWPCRNFGRSHSTGSDVVTATLLLRLAAAFAALQGIAHGALFVSARPRHGATEVAVIDAMRDNRFFAGGLGYWDYYFGYGLIAAAICLVEAVLFWQLADIAATRPILVRPMVALFIIWNLGHAALLTRYFKFPAPIVFDVIIAAVLVAAFIVAATAGTAARTA